MLCKGGCEKEAKFGKWCCESYYKCPGYKKQLSDKAKLRGNNGTRGILSKKYFNNEKKIINKTKIERPSEIEEFQLLCTNCGIGYKKNLQRRTALRSTYKPLCSHCVFDKQSKSLSKTWDKLRKIVPYEKLGPVSRKKILWEEQGKKCNHCGYDKYDLKNGPYELHHKNGDPINHNHDNEEIVCCNCHAMTKTDRFKGRKHKKSTIKLLIKNQNTKNAVAAFQEIMKYN
jgi:hypothetical protein